jgi:hypothetical protein
MFREDPAAYGAHLLQGGTNFLLNDSQSTEWNFILFSKSSNHSPTVEIGRSTVGGGDEAEAVAAGDGGREPDAYTWIWVGPT